MKGWTSTHFMHFSQKKCNLHIILVLGSAKKLRKSSSLTQSQLLKLSSSMYQRSQSTKLLAPSAPEGGDVIMYE